MEILFNNRTCENFFLDTNMMRKSVNLKVAKAIYKRYFELKSFTSSLELLKSGLDNPHYLVGNFKGMIAWSIDKKYRLILDFFEEDNEEKVIIKGVVDYHGKKDNWLVA